MSHANARLAPAGRLLMVQRVESGVPQAHVARQMGVSRGTVAKWWRRWCEEGKAGLEDRSSRPRRSPQRTPQKVEERIWRLRRSTRRGPVYLSARTGVPQATVWRILKRNGLNRLRWIDGPTGEVIRRYERTTPGELVHLDIKKVGKIPPGGGWRIHGKGKRPKRRKVGYTHLHVAVDDYSRVAYVEAHDDETAATLVGFWQRAQQWFWSNARARGRSPHRQRPELPLRRVRGPARPTGHPPPAHPPVPAPDQRQSRTLQPHPRRRIPLRQTIPIRVRAPHPPQTLDPRLQLSPTPHRRRRPTRITCQQPRAN